MKNIEKTTGKTLKRPRFNLAKKLIYSRILVTFLLILLQLVGIVLVIVKLRHYAEYFFGGSILMSFMFMIYLANCPGKNEFKLAWILPMIIFPFFGISVYLVYQLNMGGYLTKKRLAQIKRNTENLVPAHVKGSADSLLEAYPDVCGIGHYLIRCGNFYPYTNCDISYFSCGEEFYPDFFEQIRNAKRFIFIEFFIINIDESWLKLEELLAQKVSEGVEVRVLYDGLGSLMMSARRYDKILKSKGIQAKIFLPLIPFFSTQLNNRDHRKIMVIDGEVAYTGGLNMKNEYFNYGKNRFAYWKDNGVKIKGEAVGAFTTMFLQNWNLNSATEDTYDSYIENVVHTAQISKKGVVIPYGDDAYNKLDIAEDLYISIINNAKDYVYITTPYVILDSNLQDAILLALRRGVQITLIVPSRPDHLISFCIGKTFLKTLVDEGAMVYLYNKGFIHAKTFVSDDKIATIGSVNLDYRSLYHNFECGVVMNEVPVIADIKKDFEKTLEDCSFMTAESYKKIPKILRFIGRIFRIFAPLL